MAKKKQPPQPEDQPPQPVGRPSVLTPSVIEDFRRILPTVLYLESVGDYLGVERTTWRKWLKRGAIEAKRLRKSDAVPIPEEALYAEFFHTAKKARAEGEIFDAGTIKKAASEQWQAAAWRLERRFPERWGRKERLEHSTKKGQPLETNLTVTVVPPQELTDEQLDRQKADLARERAELAREKESLDRELDDLRQELRGIGHRPEVESGGAE